MRHAAVNFKIDMHAGGAKLVAIHHALIDQRVALGKPKPGRGHAVNIGGVQRCKAPVITVSGAAQVVIEKRGDLLRLQYKTLRKSLMRGRVLAPSAARVKQQLERQRQPRVTRLHSASGRQRSACAVAADGQPFWIQSEALGTALQPQQAIPGVVGSHGKLMLGRKAVIQRNDGASCQMAKLAAKHVVGCHAAHGEAAPVKVQQHRQPFERWRVQPCRKVVAVARRNFQIFRSRQSRPADFQHIGACFIGGAGLAGAECVQRRVPGALDAHNHVPHGGRQQGLRMAQQHWLNRLNTDEVARRDTL